MTTRILAAKKIQKNYKATKWVRVMNRLFRDRKLIKIKMV